MVIENNNINAVKMTYAVAGFGFIAVHVVIFLSLYNTLYKQCTHKYKPIKSRNTNDCFRCIAYSLQRKSMF